MTHIAGCPGSSACVCEEILDLHLKGAQDDVRQLRRELREVQVERRKAEREHARWLDVEADRYARLMRALKERAEALGRATDRAIEQAVTEEGGKVREDSP